MSAYPDCRECDGFGWLQRDGAPMERPPAYDDLPPLSARPCPACGGLGHEEPARDALPGIGLASGEVVR